MYTSWFYSENEVPQNRRCDRAAAARRRVTARVHGSAELGSLRHGVHLSYHKWLELVLMKKSNAS